MTLLAVPLTACGSSPPAGTWQSIGDSGFELTLDGDEAHLTFGGGPVPDCLSGVVGDPWDGTVAPSGEGRYAADFGDFGVEFEFEQWFASVDYTEMHLFMCGDEEWLYTLALQE